ncbi:MAG: hypothetical protein HYX90_10180, partial [Chloroflexi bacterium]|nr:hypothetical protein [Chloroflexota bacterium]
MTRKAPSTSNKGRPGAVCRLLRGLAGFILVEGSLALLVLACALVVARSIQNANWAETPSLAIASAAAVAIALALCRLRLPSSLPFLLGYLAG